MEIIARIKNDYTGKFGIPRQSGLVNIESRIVFEPKYRITEALRGLEGFSHIWLLWLFSENEQKSWSPTVRPPRLGGNERIGVFATRSPYRPNPIGLSCVKLVKIDYTADGAELIVSGADILNETPILDIKPYLPFTDSVPDALSGFAAGKKPTLKVNIPYNITETLPFGKAETLAEILAQNPRPAYQSDERVYGMSFAGYEIKFKIMGDEIFVISAEKE